MRILILLLLAIPVAAAPPNFVIILADNLGYGDVGCFGSTLHRTPNIDRMATEGMRLTSFYVSSGVCTPSRASLMTGRHPARVGITNWIGGDQAGALLQDDHAVAAILAEPRRQCGAGRAGADDHEIRFRH